MPLLVSLTSQRATYFALELDGSWTEPTWGLAELTAEGKSSGVWVYLLAYDQDRSNVAQQDEDCCEQTVLEVADHRSQEETCGSQKNEHGTPWIPPCLVRPGEIGLASAKNEQGSKT